MRLSILDGGHRLRARLFFTLTGRDAPDIVRTLLYRPDFFSRPLLAITAPAMRGKSHWTPGEREYLAMTTAQLHRCPFCVDSHTELTRIAAQGEIDPDNPASVRPELRAVRAFLDDPEETNQLEKLPQSAVTEALRVNLVWNVVNRLANAFGFILRGDQLHTGTRALHRFGYRFPSFLLSGGSHVDHGDPIANLRHAVLEAPAVTPPALRQAAATGAPPDPWRAYVTLVQEASYRITDTDISALRAADHTETEIYEMTVAAAVGAALQAHDAGLRAIQR